MGLRASETAELVLEDCRVPEENLLGGEEKYETKEGFMTAMKTFDNTRPLVAAMACGIGRAAYEYARDFVKENYVLSRPIPRYAAIAERLAQGGPLARGRAPRSRGARRGWPTTASPNAKEASMSKALAGQAAIRACIEAIEICGADGSIAKDHAAAREVVPRHQGLRHLRGHRADPAHRREQAAAHRSPHVLTAGSCYSSAVRSLSDIHWPTWKAKDEATLLFVIKGDQVLLIRKQRGLGAGKINGPGGRIHPGEAPRAAAIREVEEEVCVTPREITECGELSFQFVDGYSIHVHVFRASDCSGEVQETAEAVPLWTPLSAIPYDEMWADDRHWLPLMLEGRRFAGRFIFDGDAMLDFVLDAPLAK